MKHLYSTIELTKNNHLRYWFNSTELQYRRMHPYETAHCTVGSNTAYIKKNFLDSISETSMTLHKRHGTDLMFFLSGGLDSEVALRSWIRNGVSPTPFIVRFSGRLNSSDVESALKTCQELELSPVIHEFDPIDFFRSRDWLRIAVDYQCYTFYQQLLISIAEKLQKPMITVDEIELTKEINDWYFMKKEDQDGCWHRFVEKTGIPAYNNFYTFDTSTIVSFLESPTVQDLISNRIPGKIGWTSSKHLIYQELTGFKMRRRPKRTGMEMMMDIWHYVEEHTAMVLHESPCHFIFDATILHDTLKNGGKMQCNMI